MGGNKEVKGSKGKKDELGDTQKATCPGFLPTYLPHAANLIKSQQMPIEKLILSLLGAFFYRNLVFLLYQQIQIICLGISKDSFEIKALRSRGSMFESSVKYKNIALHH